MLSYRFCLYYDHSFRKQIQAKTDWKEGLFPYPSVLWQNTDV